MRRVPLLRLLEVFVSPFPPPEQVARRLDAAKAAGTLGKLKKKRPRQPLYAVTCGGCALEEDLESSDRSAAYDESRERGWRSRSIPGVLRRRFFCPYCQRDMDMQARFAIVADVDPEEGYARWADGNPYRLPGAGSK